MGCDQGDEINRAGGSFIKGTQSLVVGVRVSSAIEYRLYDTELMEGNNDDF